MENTLQTQIITQKLEPKLHYEILIVGAGPAGLMAGEHAALAGLSVAIADAMPSPARKFLMAGKSGLNLTKHEDTSTCIKKLRRHKALAPYTRRVWAQRGGQFCGRFGPRGIHWKHRTGVS